MEFYDIDYQYITYPPPKKTSNIYQKLGKILLNLRQQNRISGSLNEVLTTR